MASTRGPAETETRKKAEVENLLSDFLVKKASTESVLEYCARICKRPRSPGIDSKEWIPPAYVTFMAGRVRQI